MQSSYKKYTFGIGFVIIFGFVNLKEYFPIQSDFPDSLNNYTLLWSFISLYIGIHFDKFEAFIIKTVKSISSDIAIFSDKNDK